PLLDLSDSDEDGATPKATKPEWTTLGKHFITLIGGANYYSPASPAVWYIPVPLSKTSIWINNSHTDEKCPQWMAAQGANALQSIDGKDYRFYITHDGPHWVMKDTLGKYK
ncbi:hypothetical protein P691DRAFT_784202, partial [Macrolepiota fuliginosa MF-IS2]